MKESFPTEEQAAVLKSDAGVTAVRASPGSGKTRVFVEALNQRLTSWAERHAGVAALSFTNVAQQEIAKRLGGHPFPPHFVGTLDSFMLRFVVRPFAHLIGVSAQGARLIPAPVSEAIEFPKVEFGMATYQTASVFRIHLKDGSEAAPNIVVRDETTHALVSVEPPFNARAFAAKRSEWQRGGRVTHSDCHFIAASILNHPTSGDAVARFVARRFPVILVDELQDTGWFLGRALLALLRCPTVTSLVVSDPDQAIYEFGGARVTLFDDIERLSGAAKYTLSQTQRCSRSVSALTTALSESGKTVVPKLAAVDGQTALLVHDLNSKTSVATVLARVREIWGGSGSFAVLARRGLTVRRLVGSDLSTGFKGSSNAGRRIDRAVMLLNSGDASGAAGVAAKEIGTLVFDDETPTLDRLNTKSISLREWRAAVFNVLTTAASEIPGETWNEWLTRVKECIRSEAAHLGWTGDAAANQTFGARFKKAKEGDEFRLASAKTANPSCLGDGFHVSTIHKVKGAEFDCVALFVPKPHARYSPCPSSEWWQEGTSNEERRIAFVAVSRAKRTFVLCVHRKTYLAFKAQKPEFLKLFNEILE